MDDLNLRLNGPLGAPELLSLRQQLSQWLGQWGAPRDDIYAAVSVLDEFASNLMEHSGAAWIELKAAVIQGRIQVSLRDNGARFDSAEAARRDYGDYLKSDTDRRLGLFLIGRLTDELRYEREEADSINCLTFLLKFKGWEASENP